MRPGGEPALRGARQITHPAPARAASDRGAGWHRIARGCVLLYRGHRPTVTYLVRSGRVAFDLGRGRRAARGVELAAPLLLGSVRGRHAPPAPVTARAATDLMVRVVEPPARGPGSADRDQVRRARPVITPPGRGGAD